MTPHEQGTVSLARSYVGTREEGNNRGELIIRWQAFCGAHPGDSYCACFVSWCVIKGVGGLEGPPPTFLRSAGALRLLVRNSHLAVSSNEARDLLSQGTPLVFVQDHGGGHGHTGFALSLFTGDHFHSIEANTGPGPAVAAKDRNGDGVYEREDRSFGDVVGWLRIG